MPCRNLGNGNVYRKIVKVFLGSPGDLSQEREVAFRIVQEINRDHADFWNAQVELVGWEDTVSRFGRAQAVINQDLDQCEYFIGIIWQRWGSPPGGKDHPYTSGFHEEFMRSVDRRTKTGVPEISLLFKAPEAGRLQDPGKELTRVLQFKDTVIAEKKILFQEFKEDLEFERKFRSLVVNYVQQTILAERKIDARKDSEIRTNEAGVVDTQTDDPDPYLFQNEANTFVLDLLSRTNPLEAVSAADLARLRLLGASIARAGNDTMTLGVHDANLVFGQRDEFQLTQAEISALICSGAEHNSHQNAPLWGWVFRAVVGLEEVVWQALMRQGPLKSALIKCLTQARYDLSSDSTPMGRERLLTLWLENENDDIKGAVLEYLEECGTAADIELLKAPISSTDTTVSERAVVAAVMLSVKTDVENALDLLQRHPVSSVPERVLNALFASPGQLRSDKLMPFILYRSPDLRARVIRTLFDRDSISPELANELLDDQSAQNRYLAIRVLQRTGRTFGLKEAKTILVRTRPQGYGILMGSRSGKEGEAEFKSFQRHYYSTFSLESLKEEVEKADVYEWDALYALYALHFKQYLPQITSALDDTFVSEFGRRLENMRPDIGGFADLMTQVESLSSYLREEASKRVLSIVCEHGDASAMGLVRRTLDREQPPFAEEIVEFLKRYGAWEDVKRIAALVERRNYAKAGFLYDSSAEYRSAAKAILKLGKMRAADLLSLSISSSLLAHVIAEMANKQFAELSDASILVLMTNEGDAVRKAASLKSILSLTRGRNRKLLQTYAEGDQYRYYNVVHWLDVAVNTPVSFGRALAARELTP